MRYRTIDVDQGPTALQVTRSVDSELRMSLQSGQSAECTNKPAMDFPFHAPSYGRLWPIPILQLVTQQDR
jgi:hypothetical protein